MNTPQHGNEITLAVFALPVLVRSDEPRQVVMFTVATAVAALTTGASGWLRPPQGRATPLCPVGRCAGKKVD
jgi:hypothetical protein